MKKMANRSRSRHRTVSSDSNLASSEISREKNHDSGMVQNSYISSVDVIQALKRLDNRSVPKPEKFDSSSGYSFKQFLATFEEYCSHTYRGSSSLWVSEMGRFLTGEMLSAYEALKVAGDDYEVVKRKLLRWRKDSKETYEINSRDRFAHAKKEHDETYRLYAARLEKLFRLAYPSRSVMTSNTLRRKYFNSVPKGFRKQ